MSLLQRLWNVFRRARLDDELRQEIETHLAMIEADERAQGSSADQARRDARARFVRSATPATGLVPSVRRVVDTVDANLPLADVRILQAILDHASAQMAFTMVLLAIAAIVALALGVVGIYGVTSYLVSQRTSEIGIRLALGAEPHLVVRMIVRQGGLVALTGTAVGLATAIAGSRTVASLLYGVGPRDPGVFGATALLLFGIALLACWVPARSAARISPLEALRTE